jgi:hypothetical protein
MDWKNHFLHDSNGSHVVQLRVSASVTPRFHNKRETLSVLCSRKKKSQVIFDEGGEVLLN